MIINNWYHEWVLISPPMWGNSHNDWLFKRYFVMIIRMLRTVWFLVVLYHHPGIHHFYHFLVYHFVWISRWTRLLHFVKNCIMFRFFSLSLVSFSRRVRFSMCSVVVIGSIEKSLVVIEAIMIFYLYMIVFMNCWLSLLLFSMTAQSYILLRIYFVAVFVVDIHSCHVSIGFMNFNQGKLECFAEYFYPFLLLIKPLLVLGATQLITTMTTWYFFLSFSEIPWGDSLVKINIFKRTKLSKRWKLIKSIPHDKFHRMIKFTIFDIFVNRTQLTEIEKCLNYLFFPSHPILWSFDYSFGLQLIHTEVLMNPSFSSFRTVVSHHIFGNCKLPKLLGQNIYPLNNALEDR